MTLIDEILAEVEYSENGIIGKTTAQLGTQKTEKWDNGTPGAQKQPPKRENGISRDPDPSGINGKTGNSVIPGLEEKEEQAIRDIITAMDQHTGHGHSVAVAFSGGSDSLVLLDLFYRSRSHPAYMNNPDCDIQPRPYILWIDTQMEYPETRDFVKRTLRKYNLDARLRIAKATRTPQDQWHRTGYPILGKMAARQWMQKYRGMGFAVNVSECCRAMKIQPARKLTRNLGCSLQITGQRGQQDDQVRGLRKLKDGILFYQERDRIWISNPLSGWTDEEIAAYIKLHKLEEHPARAKGAKTIGCMYCGGGSQYTNSGYRVLRFVDAAAWRRLIIDYGIGPIILSIKYKRSLFYINLAIKEMGGLSLLASTRPWVFDFTRKTPLKGYNK